MARILLVTLDLGGVLFLGLTVSLLSGTQITGSSLSGKILQFMGSSSRQNVYLSVAIVSLAFFLFKSAASLLLNRRIAAFGARIESEMATNIFTAVLKQKYLKDKNVGPKELIYAVTGSANSAFSQSFISVSVALGEIALLACVSIVLAYSNAVLYGITVLFFGAFTLAMSRFVSQRTAVESASLQESSLHITRAAIEGLENKRQILTSGKVSHFADLFNEEKRFQAGATGRLVLLGYLPRYLTEIALIAGLCLLVAIKATSFVGGIDGQTVTIFAGGAFRIIASLLPLQATLTNLKRVDVEGQMALNLASEFRQPSHYAADRELTQTPAIEVRNITFNYGSGAKSAITNLSISVPFGSVLSVRGESGSGKSTFADLLIGLREPDAGQIIVGGVPLSDYLRMDPRGIALVPQEIHLFDGTIAANVALSFKGEIPDFDRVTDALVEAGLMPEVDSLPQGIQTQIGKYGHRLSGGQVQRIGLARALYQKPKILLLDEATSALDQESEATIVKTLSRLKGRVTLIVIAHRPATLSLSDQELVF